MKTSSEKGKKLNLAINKLQNINLENPSLKNSLENLDQQKKEIEFSEKIDELNQETDTLLEEIDKWQI